MIAFPLIQPYARRMMAAGLLLALAGCGDCSRKDGACEIPGAVVVTNVVYKLTPEVIDQLIAQAFDAAMLGDPENPMPPLPDEEVAATNRAAAVRLQMRDTARELGRQVQRRNEHETRFRNEEPEGKALWETFQAAKKEYDTLLADYLSGTLVPGRIAQLTRRQRELFAQLQKLEETP